MRFVLLISILPVGGCSLINDKIYDPLDLSACADCGDLSRHDGPLRGDGFNGDDGPPPDLRMPADLKPMCAAATDCSDPAEPICAQDGGTCRGCLSSADDSQCVAHAAGKLCLTEGTNAGQCGDCRPASNTQSANCATATPVCAAAGSCRKCQAHGECTSQVCLASGSCAASANVLYVNNLNGACTESGQNGLTPATAFCAIKDAMGALSSTRTIIRIFGSTTEYSQLSTSDLAPAPTPPAAFSVFGDGPSASPRSQIYDPTKNGVKAVITTGSLSITIDGIVIGDDTATSTTDGVLCSNTGTTLTLNITRSLIQKSGGAGVNSSNCATTMDRDLVSGSSGGGISINGGYEITNCFIQANVSSGSFPAVTFNSSSAPIGGGPGFSHNTVAANSVTAGVAGIECNVATTISNSILWSNTAVATLMETGGGVGCTLSSSSVDPTPSPDFVNSSVNTAMMPFNFHLTGRTTANNACCIDKIPSSPVDHDYDGRPRPQPVAGMFDIGAHEVP